jgi:microcystin-dependent protein
MEKNKKKNWYFIIVILISMTIPIISPIVYVSTESAISSQNTRPKSSASVQVPVGGIVMWSGPINTIPDGWSLCNGSNGTPDLRDKFIQGAFFESDINTTGGSAAPHNHSYNNIVVHSHSISSGSHNHDIDIANTGATPGTYLYRDNGMDNDLIYPSNEDYGITIDYEGEVNPSTEFASYLPPYYKLAFIMKTVAPGALPPGAIVMSSSKSIPSGWALCDGTSGTPDLRDKLIYGVSQGENPGATGTGSHNHTYTEIYYHTHGHSDYSHNHIIKIDTIINGYGPGYPVYGDDSNPSGQYSTDPEFSGITINNYGVDPATTENSTNLPPYCELTFIMKLSNPGAPPYKSIILWPRVHDLIPDKFAICNDMNDTFDLRDRFILSGEIPGRKGGSETHTHIMTEVPRHTHSITDPGHSHTFPISDTIGSGPDTLYANQVSGTSHIDTRYYSNPIWIQNTGVPSLTTNEAGSLPPYHALTFIQMIYSSGASGDIIIIDDDDDDDDSQDDGVITGLIITVAVISLISTGTTIFFIRYILTLKRQINPKEGNRIKRSQNKIRKKK